jgi:hypothetical protein
MFAWLRDMDDVRIVFRIEIVVGNLEEAVLLRSDQATER